MNIQNISESDSLVKKGIITLTIKQEHSHANYSM